MKLKKGLDRVFEKIGDTFMPARARPNIRQYLMKAGITKVPYRDFGMMFFLAFLITVFSFIFINISYLSEPVVSVLGFRFGTGSLFMLFFTFLYFTLVQLCLSVLFIYIAKFYFDLKIYQRTSKIEEVLPAFLQAVNTNLKAGMTFDKALWNAVEEDYSVLEKEIEIVAKKSMSGEDMTEALNELVSKYDSPILKEAISIIIAGIEQGGNITDIIEELVKNIEETTYMKRQAVASVTNYVIFIALIATVISPVLFAFSFNLLVILQSIGSKIAASSSVSGGNLPLFIGEIHFSPGSFIAFSRFSIGAISVASTFILVSLVKGDIKAGIKYLPLFVVGSLLIYQIALKVLTYVFSAVF